MTNDELRALNRTRHIQQIAWLTRDLEKSMQAWIDTLRIGPWRVFRFTEKTVKNLKVDGKLVEGPFEFRIAITHVGDMEIELIEPVRGPMIYEDYIRRRGEGLHHIKEKVPDDRMGQVVQDYAARDVKVTQTGQFVADFHFYLDTEPKLDFVYELGNCPYQDLPPELVSIYPAEESAPKRA
jgi:methylmalonyl-CoA/ethylmalonyl-CoA epimerase